MRVRDLMKSHPSVTFGGQSLEKAGRTMARVECGVLPVLGDDDDVVGIVTDRDVCLTLARDDLRPSEATVEEAMSAPVRVCSPADDLQAALATMRDGRIRRLPVVDARGRVEGLLSLDDIALAAHETRRDELEGPLLEDVARTLQEIVRHDLPATATSAG